MTRGKLDYTPIQTLLDSGLVDTIRAGHNAMPCHAVPCHASPYVHLLDPTLVQQYPYHVQH